MTQIHIEHGVQSADLVHSENVNEFSGWRASAPSKPFPVPVLISEQFWAKIFFRSTLKDERFADAKLHGNIMLSFTYRRRGDNDFFFSQIWTFETKEISWRKAQKCGHYQNLYSHNWFSALFSCLLTFLLTLLTCWWRYRTSQGINKVIIVCPLITMNMCTKFHSKIQ